MSSVPTELSMNGMNLFTSNEIVTCTVYNFKVFLLILLILLFVSSLSTVFKIFSKNTCGQDIGYYDCGCGNNCNCQGGCNVDCGCNCRMEHFGNDNFYSYKNIDYASYKSIPLTPLGESLIFGQANRYIKPDIYILDIFCNLYLLNGNVFGKNSAQKYRVYVTKDGDNRKLIGDLESGSDQVYKLKFTSKNVSNYLSFNNLEIVYQDENKKENVILKGSFK